MKGALSSSETLVLTRAIQHKIPEDNILYKFGGIQKDFIMLVLEL
jgi:hypothetical protein